MRNKCLLLTLLISLPVVLVSQPKVTQPTVMVVPSDALMNKLGYLQRVTDNGVTSYIPDYRRAFVENTDLVHVISKIGELFSDRGFNLKDLDYELRQIQQESVEDMALESKNGGEVATSLLDMVLNNVRPDIVLELTYELKNAGGPMHSFFFDIQAKDAYTREQVGAASGAGPNTTETLLIRMAGEAVVNHIDNLQSQMQNYFDDISAHGRKIYARVQIFDDAGFDFEDELGDDELGEELTAWMKRHSLDNTARITKNTPNEMRYTLRIPLFDQEGMPMSAYEFAEEIAGFLKSTYGIRTRKMTQGIGDARLVIRGRK